MRGRSADSTSLQSQRDSSVVTAGAAGTDSHCSTLIAQIRPFALAT